MRCIDCKYYKGGFGYAVTGYCLWHEKHTHPMESACGDFDLKEKETVELIRGATR